MIKTSCYLRYREVNNSGVIWRTTAEQGHGHRAGGCLMSRVKKLGS